MISTSFASLLPFAAKARYFSSSSFERGLGKEFFPPIAPVKNTILPIIAHRKSKNIRPPPHKKRESVLSPRKVRPFARKNKSTLSYEGDCLYYAAKILLFSKLFSLFRAHFLKDKIITTPHVIFMSEIVIPRHFLLCLS